MSAGIRKVAVLGSGVMGSGIASHVANAGIPVLLLDMVPPKAGAGEDERSPRFRNKFAAGALEKLDRQKPPPLFTPAIKEAIAVGNFDDDLPRIADCDWVVEVVKEDLAVKRALFARVEPHLKPGAIISSNTSGLSLQGMTEGRGAAFQRNFLVTHFFNPVRYMKLLELVAGEQTDPDVVRRFARFGEEVLGKGIVYAKDTITFIANRVGSYAMLRAIQAMPEAGLTVEEVDAIFGPVLGRPKSAVFRTADVVGLDTFVHVADNCHQLLTQDEERERFKVPPYVEQLVQRGRLGAKTGEGFYKAVPGKHGEKEILALDVKTLEYRPQKKPRFESLGAARGIEDVGRRIATVLHGKDAAAAFAEQVTLETLAYASRRIPEIADDLVNIDRALKWGWGWELGPFEIWDAYGVQAGVERMKQRKIQPAAWVEAMLRTGRSSFYAVDGVRTTAWAVGAGKAEPVPENPRTQRVEYLRRGNRKLLGNPTATLWDLGDEVGLLEFHSKMNSIDEPILALLNQALDRAERELKGLVIGNDGANFSAGANIAALLKAIQARDFEAVRRMAQGLQQANQRLHYSPVPVIAAPFNLTLGGGCEIALAASGIQASAELNMGLVEAGVGLIPGGGGTMMLLRNVYGAFGTERDFSPLPFLKKVFMAIGTAKVSSSADEARELGFLRSGDGITFNRDFLLSDAKARVLGLARSGYRPPRPTRFLLPGRSGAATVDMMLFDMEQNGLISAYDRQLGQKLAFVLSGGDTSRHVPVTEERLLALELEAFLSLAGEEKTQARLAHMLETGRPLRN